MAFDLNLLLDDLQTTFHGVSGNMDSIFHRDAQHMYTTAHTERDALASEPHYVATPLPPPTNLTYAQLPWHCTPAAPRASGAERHQRARPAARRAPDAFFRMTRDERASHKHAAAARRVAFADDDGAASSSAAADALWDGLAAPAPRRPRRAPTPIPATTTTSDEDDSSRGSSDELDMEDDSAGSASDGGHVLHAPAPQRLTITVPGGKSDAFFALSFERACNLSSSTTSTTTSPAAFSVPPTPAPTPRSKTGLKIRIPAPGSAVLLALQLARACRVGGAEADDEGGASSSSGSSADTDVDADADAFMRMFDGVPRGGARVSRGARRAAAAAPYALARTARQLVH
ncbi:hypothetical protein BC834DRAFT_971966 [Gloeopeniophorella convolvens]|nr:hypothetical protein BC834DRAFT_971966 [Gloeopeniophorella convolvens]